MERKRPQGRETYVTDNSKGVQKRGDGLGTGKVGSGNAFSGGSGSGRGQSTQQPGQSSGSQSRPGASFHVASGSSGSSGSGTRSSGGGRGMLLLIIIAAVVLFGGGGGLLGGLFGGSSDDSAGYYDSDAYGGSYGDSYGDSYATQQPQTQPFTQSGTQSGAADASVASGSRAKYTTIAGGGQDSVTVMVYMCGTDLESEARMGSNDLAEMAQASWGDNMHVLVYTGGCKKWQTSAISSTTNQIYEVKDGGITRLVADDGAKPMTDPATLTGFIRWCAQNYPANRNELILWDHGGGSLSGYGYDEKFKSSGSMTLDNISKALSDAGMKFDFIGFDACLMATVETGLMLDPFADYLIASEETEPGIGWYYTDWLNALGRDTSMSTVSVGKNIVDSFVTTCARSCPGQSATLSVIDLAELSNTVPDSLKSFSQSLSSLITNDNYQQISSARSSTREFARSSAIDQIDLADFATRVGTAEGRELAADIAGAVKYNRYSSGMSNSNGVSIYFPYRKSSSVGKAVSTYSAIGMDESYSQAIREFASLEAAGQAASGGAGGSFSSLLESLYGGGYSGGYSSGSSAYSSSSSAYSGSDLIGSLLTSFLTGGGLGFDRAMSNEDTIAYITANYLDPASLVWSENADGELVIALTDEQWELVNDVDLNMFYDDGEGYIDLGLDNIYDFDDDGNLLPRTDRTWLAVNGQPVAYYREASDDDGTITGYIPAFVNGVRSELLVTFDATNPRGSITGVRTVYVDEETETIPKSGGLAVGDTLEFICDYYTYDGEYVDSYYLGEPMTVTDTMELSNVDVGDGDVLITYRFTDIYDQSSWTPSLIG